MRQRRASFLPSLRSTAATSALQADVAIRELAVGGVTGPAVLVLCDTHGREDATQHGDEPVASSELRPPPPSSQGPHGRQPPTTRRMTLMQSVRPSRASAHVPHLTAGSGC